VVVAVVAVLAVVLVIVAVVTYQRRRSHDAVESFRRQIDALSPEARRNVVDQVNRIDDATSNASDDEPADQPGDDDDS
jgi:type II secretory pathway pseudopilin PulG